MKDILRYNNLKVTKGRVEVLRLLKNNPDPLSVEEIYNGISRESCKSLTTAYRIVNQLEENNIIRRVIQKDGVSFYAFSLSPHKHYIICSECGSLYPIDKCPIKPFEDFVKKESGYEVTGHIIEFYGICPKCKQEKGD